MTHLPIAANAAVPSAAPDTPLFSPQLAWQYLLPLVGGRDGQMSRKGE